MREPVKKPAFPLSKQQAQSLKKQSFWRLGRCWQVGEGCTCKREGAGGTPHPWELRTQRQRQQVTPINNRGGYRRYKKRPPFPGEAQHAVTKSSSSGQSSGHAGAGCPWASRGPRHAGLPGPGRGGGAGRGPPWPPWWPTDKAEFSKVPKAFSPSVSPNLLEQKVGVCGFFSFFLFQRLFEIENKSGRAGELGTEPGRGAAAPRAPGSGTPEALPAAPVAFRTSRDGGRSGDRSRWLQAAVGAAGGGGRSWGLGSRASLFGGSPVEDG